MTDFFLRRSFSPLTVFDIRFTRPRDDESNPMMIQRLAKTYDVSPQDIRLMITLDDDLLDSFGRPKEDA